MSLVLSVLYVFLFVFHGVEGGNAEGTKIENNKNVTLTCGTDNTGTKFWLRLKENGQGFEYIATYSISKKGKAADPSKFTVNEKSLTLKHFEQEDSGTYTCFSINNNELKFSGTTKLHGNAAPTIKPTVKPTQVQTVATTTKAVMTCRPNSKDALWGCELHIFIPLAVGCGVLLLILLFTILYCNRIRTRRCPHHYKRQPRSRPAGHKTLPDPMYY